MPRRLAVLRVWLDLVSPVDLSESYGKYKEFMLTCGLPSPELPGETRILTWSRCSLGKIVGKP